MVLGEALALSGLGWSRKGYVRGHKGASAKLWCPLFPASSCCNSRTEMQRNSGIRKEQCFHTCPLVWLKHTRPLHIFNSSIALAEWSVAGVRGQASAVGWRPHSGPGAWRCQRCRPPQSQKGLPASGLRVDREAPHTGASFPNGAAGRGAVASGCLLSEKTAEHGVFWAGVVMGTAPLTSHCRQHRPPPSAPWPDAPMLQRAPGAQVGPTLGLWGHLDPARPGL